MPWKMWAQPRGSSGHPSHQASALCSWCLNLSPIAGGAGSGLGSSHILGDVPGQGLVGQAWRSSCWANNGSPTRNSYLIVPRRKALEKVRGFLRSHILALDVIPPELPLWESDIPLGFWLKMPIFLFLP